MTSPKSLLGPLAINKNPGFAAQQITKVLKSGGTYLSFSLLNRAIPFLLLPLLTRYIDPAGYGVIAVVAIITSIGMPVVGMCSHTVLNQRYFRLSGLERVTFINDCYKIIVLNTILAGLVAFPFSSLINTHLKISLGWFEVGIICAGAGMVSTLTTTLLQLKKEPLRYGLFQTLSSSVNIALTIVLVIVLELSWQGRLYAILSSYIALALWAVHLNVRDGDVDFSRIRESSQITSIARLGSLLIPSTISGWAVTMSDRMFLTAMTSLEIVGIYAVGVMIAQITDIFLAALARACQPYFFEYGYSDDPYRRIRIVQGIYGIVFISLLTALIVTLIAPLIMYLMVDERYHSGAAIVGWMCLSYAFFNISSAFLNLLLIVEKNSVTIYVSFSTFVVSLFGNYLLIREYGMVGAAMGSALSAFVFMSLLILAGLIHNRLPWLDKRVLQLSFAKR